MEGRAPLVLPAPAQRARPGAARPAAHDGGDAPGPLHGYLRSHQNVVHIWHDPVNMEWCVGHSMSRERVVLAPGPSVPQWALEFDGDGFAQAVQDKEDGDIEVRSLEDLFRIDVLESNRGGVLLQFPSDYTGKRGEVAFLSDLRRSYQYYKFVISNVGALNSEITIELALYERLEKDSGCFAMLSWPAIFRGLNLELRGGVPHLWLQKMWPSWESFLARLDGLAELTRSQLYNKKGVVKDEARHLPWLAMCPVGVVAVVCRLVANDRTAGGAAEEEVKIAFRYFLDALVAGASSDEWSFVVFMDKGCRLQPWPAGPVGENPVVFVVQGGLLEQVPLEDCPFFQHEGLRAWVAKCSVAGGRSFADALVELTALGKAGEPLAKQFYRELGRRVDDIISVCAEQTTEGNMGCFRVELPDGAMSSVTSDIRLESKLCRYQRSCQAACKGDLLHLSVAADKSRVGSLGIMNGIAALPNNIGMSLAPQVVPDYMSEEFLAEVLGEEGGKEEALKCKAQREQEYLNHVQQPEQERAGRAAWRPRQRHRKDSFQWLCMLDHQLATTTGVSLAHFRVPDPPHQPPWQCWPLLSVSADQGSVEQAGTNFAQQKLHLNWDDICDPSHGVWNDCRLALKKSNLGAHIALMLTTHNVPHGPWAEDVRYSEIVGATQSFFKHYKEPSSSPIFISLIPKMLFNLQDTGLESCADPAQAVFEHMRKYDPFSVKGSKTSMNRFMSVLKCGESMLSDWNFRYFAYLITCLEQDYIKNASIPKLKPKPEDASVRTTSSSRSSPLESAIAKSAQNQLVVATLMLGEPSHELRHRLIVASLRPLLRWFEHQSHYLRDVEHSKQWLTDQLREDFMRSLSEVVGSLVDEHTIRWIGFRVPAVVGGIAGTETNEVEIEENNELATCMAEVCFNVVGCRIQRCLFMLRGWSCRSVMWLTMEPDALGADLKEFKRELDLFDRHKNSDGALQKVLKESQLQLMPVKQLALGLAETNFERVSRDMRKFLDQKHRRIFGTQAVEDSFQRQKRLKQTHYTNRLKVAASWEVLLDKQVLDSVHGYNPPPKQNAAPERTSWLQADIFDAPFKGSCDFSGITNFKAATDWYSPGASRHGNKYATGTLLDYADKWGCLGKVGDAWLATLFRPSHSILVRQSFPDKTYGPPCFVCGFLEGSIAMVWPALRLSVPGAPNKHCWVPRTDTVSVRECLAVVIDLNHWQAMSIAFRSPAWQHDNLPSARGKWSSCIRAFARDKQSWQGLLTVAAQCGFWTMSQENLKSIARHIGMQHDLSTDLFSLTLKLCQHILGCNDTQALEVCKKRAAAMDAEGIVCYDALVEMDECIGMFDANDRKEMRDEKERFTKKGRALKDFMKSWTEAKQKAAPSVPRSAAVVQSSAGSGGSKGGKAKPSPYPPYPSGMISQPDAKRLIPPGTSIWRGLSRGSWECHCPPWPRRSFSWHVHGFNDSARKAIRFLWERYLEDLGLETSACPVVGLFDAPAAAEAEPGHGASSSSSGVAHRAVAVAADATAVAEAAPAPANKRRRKK